MNQPRRANRDLIKALNRNLILNIVRSEGPLSRTQVTHISGLSVGAVSQLVSELLHEGWLIEAGESESTGGRRQVMLRLNPTAGYVVGLKLMEDRVVCAVTDLETSVLTYAERPMSPDYTPQVVSAELAETVTLALAEARIDPARVFGVGIGLAGVIDCASGIVHYSPFFQWRNVPLADLVAARLNLPVYLENDVNTLTITEQLFGPGHSVPNFVVVTVGRGIGMGTVLNHQLYQGVHGGVGELGHVTIDENGPRCACGKYGCLEAMAADPAVIGDVESALTRGARTRLTSSPRLADIVRAADEGDALAQDALARSGHYLGIGLATVINMLCPSLLIISGEGVVAGDHRLKPMFESLRKHTFNGLLDSVQIVIKPTDDRTWARGAAGLVVGKLFESPLLERIESQPVA